MLFCAFQDLAAHFKILHGTLVYFSTPVENHWPKKYEGSREKEKEMMNNDGLEKTEFDSGRLCYRQFHQQHFSRAFFVRMLFRQLFLCTYVCTYIEKRNSYEKSAQKMLMKLTPIVNFINVKRTNFLYERTYVLAAFTTYM